MGRASLKRHKSDLRIADLKIAIAKSIDSVDDVHIEEILLALTDTTAYWQGVLRNRIWEKN